MKKALIILVLVLASAGMATAQVQTQSQAKAKAQALSAGKSTSSVVTKQTTTIRKAAPARKDGKAQASGTGSKVR